MAHGYVSVGWNRQKRIYDLCAVGGVLAYLALFVGVSLRADPNAAADTVVLRALGTCAALLLHVVLSIGPLARLDARFLPLVYNRRHLGVLTFLVALAHATFVLLQYHALGVANPLVHVLAGERPLGGVAGLPFQPVGAGALAILFVMASTSHDSWLANLSPATWKRLHMSVYAAWALVVLHVAAGYLQSETGVVPTALVGLGITWVLGLHLVAGWRERARDRDLAVRGNLKLGAGSGGFVDVCAVDDIPEGRAHVATLGGERVAIFRHAGAISVVSNVCRHQNGPLGEGRVIDGCITCPWHGYQYRPEDGCSPPPFTEKVETYRVKLAGRRVLVDPRALAPGTRVEPVRFEERAT
ncbi:MAG TPA: Rieske 2Fe-2S domain-containing protein [Planctomycetota bacterium]|nr:Rieske 2Fe-2S domain-containing protein [Planctomycetota bacterium]